ncbi:MAG: AMP-binding protein [Desulfotomaculaceae bacterium]|nr:AMP-binding protein [Desulfotomaculaceae bacterium]
MDKRFFEKWNYPAPPESYLIEKANPEIIREIQNHGLRRLVRHCWENVPFYRSRWEKVGLHPEDIRGIEDIGKLPIVTKAELEKDLKDNPPFGTFQGSLPACRIQSSTGTTGMPKPFFQSKRDWDVIGNLWARRLNTQGITAGDPVQVSFTYALFIPGFTSTEGAMKLGAMVIPTGSGAVTNTERQVTLARDWGAKFLLMTPSFALYFADVAEKMGYDLKKDFQIKSLIHVGEPLPPTMRQRIEERWGCLSFDNWGSVETGAPTFECEHRNGLHIFEDAYYFEVIDPETGKSLPDGEEGILTVTTLFKELSPLVRYSIGDYTSIIPEPCSCGRSYRRMTNVRARIDDMVKVRGSAVYPMSAEQVVRKYKELGSEYRLVVDTINNQDVIKLQVEVMAESVSEELKEKIYNDLIVVLGIKTEVELLPFGTLAQEASAGGRIKFKRLLDLRNK